jgi:hypothetical protein
MSQPDGEERKGEKKAYVIPGWGEGGGGEGEMSGLGHEINELSVHQTKPEKENENYIPELL